ncbi:hypothetical protein BGZ94_005374, partial [Podila epigama]
QSGHQKSPVTGFPMDGDPYSNTRSQASSQTTIASTRFASPASQDTPEEDGTMPLTPTHQYENEVGRSERDSNTQPNEQGIEDGSKKELEEAEETQDFVHDHSAIQRIHERAMMRKNTEELQQRLYNEQQDNRPMTPPPEGTTSHSIISSEPILAPPSGGISTVVTRVPENTFRQELHVVTQFDAPPQQQQQQQGPVVLGGNEANDNLTRSRQYHSANTHLHSPPITTPEDQMRQQPLPFTTEAASQPSGGIEGPVVPGQEAQGQIDVDPRQDEMAFSGGVDVVSLSFGHDHQGNDKRHSIPDTVQQQQLQQEQGQDYTHNLQQPYSASSSIPYSQGEQKQEYNNNNDDSNPSIPCTPSDPYHPTTLSTTTPLTTEDQAAFYQTPGLSSHRSSINSVDLLRQQQEFLRRARLQSQPDIHQPYALGTFNSTLEQHPPLNSVREEAEVSTVPPQSNLYSYNDKAEFQSSQELIQQNPSSFMPFTQGPPPSKEEYIEPMHVAQSTSVIHLADLQSPPPQGTTTTQLQDKKPMTGNDPYEGRPSYSSSHLQHYVDTTMSNVAAVPGRQRAYAGHVTKPYHVNGGNAGNGGNGDNGGGGGGAIRTSTGGIHGEDAQGRWVGGANPETDVRQW